uniref:Auxin efflux carrier component n=1 Tax=Ananas comosus var. bracteatus TaxID=296719 RepID=A0A6V7NTQ1_ANACO|nr:unnamed protein product [Ananas comosus var. bracteatus]
MISGSDLYRVVSAMAPLYTAMGLGYASVRWWRVLSADHCAGIGRFVAVLAVPLLVFRIVAGNNPYAMNPRLLLADSLEKLLLLAALLLWALLRRRSSSSSSSSSSPPLLAWAVTVFSLATLPNTAIIGIPLLNGMYGPDAGVLVAQIIFPQLIVWYNLIIFVYELIAARRTAAAPRSENPNTSIGGGGGDTADFDITVLVSEGGDMVLSKMTKEEENAGAGDGGGKNAAAVAAEEEETRRRETEVVPVRKVMAVAVRKLAKVPSTYASFLGLLWSLIAFRYGIQMPTIIDGSLSIISSTAVGLSMFSVGTFMARQPRFISCGYRMAIIATVIKFLVGPLIMAGASLAVGLRGTLLRVAIVQAALPLAVLSFVYAEEYKLHPDIMSTAVITGNFVSLPVTILYYILLGLCCTKHS